MAELHKLGPLGQMPNVATYTILTLGFATKPDSRDQIISELEQAANKLTESYPWLAGQVVIKGRNNVSSGTFSIVEYPPHAGKAKFVSVKDCSSEIESFATLVARKAPSALLKGDILSPGYGFACFYPSDVVQPVTFVQANFIEGGLLLTICTHHCVMDANGNEQLIRQFAALLQGEKLIEEEVKAGNSDQNAIITPRTPDDPSYDALSFLRTPSALNVPPSPWPPTSSPGSAWHTFRFSATKVAALKAAGSKHCSTAQDGVSFISSNDSLTAFIWQRVLAARLKAGLPTTGNSQLVRAINMRERVEPPVPKGYMGHVIYCATATAPVDSFAEPPIHHPVLELRKTLTDVGDKQMSSFFHQLQTEQDKTTISYGAHMKNETDLMITSFAKQKLYHTSFGDTLSVPAFVRRPDLITAPGLFYIMPLTREGDYDLIACVSDEEYKNLLADERWKEYAELLN